MAFSLIPTPSENLTDRKALSILPSRHGRIYSIWQVGIQLSIEVQFHVGMGIVS